MSAIWAELILALFCILALLLFILRGRTAPDVHPLLLSQQADISLSRLPSESPVCRSRFAPYGGPLLSSSDRNVKTVYDLWRFGGGMKEGEGKFMGSKKGSVFQWPSKPLAQVNERIRNFGTGLVKFASLSPRSGEKIGIFTTNSPEYIITLLAAAQYSLISVPIPEKQTTESLRNIINHVELSVIVANSTNLSLVLSAANGCQFVRHIVVVDDLVPQELAKRAQSRGSTLTTFKALEALGEEDPLEPALSSPDDLAFICLTNGTTDEPKYVSLTHQNIVANVSACLAILPPNQKLTSKDRHISYLPMAYAFERTMILLMIFVGGSIAFFGGDMNGIFEDIRDAQPTIFASVPKYLTRLQEMINKSYGGSFLFRNGFASKRALLRRGSLTMDSMWDRLVFRAVRTQLLGGAVRVVISGSAPIEAQTLTFLRVVLGCPVIQTYGLTEAVSAVTLSNACDYREDGSVGPPLPCCEIKLVDSGENTTDKPLPRGEICVRGPSVMRGYYRDEKLTALVIDKEGWLHTGDLGMLLPDGTFKILDRKIAS
ncbi:uncharacterized protein VTP21DRAFT_5766 [Calcarisporiella thermophila]|uniref:uncharacterized protein n=1 Tax=Calcarisporiella thermophila TaxID=911321 RepID=UPI0037447C70